MEVSPPTMHPCPLSCARPDLQCAHTPLSPVHVLGQINQRRRATWVSHRRHWPVRLGPPPPLPPRPPRAPTTTARASSKCHRPSSPDASPDLLPIMLLSRRRRVHDWAALHRPNALDWSATTPGLHPSSMSTLVSIPHPAGVALHRPDAPDQPATTPGLHHSSTSAPSSIPPCSTSPSLLSYPPPPLLDSQI
jgi:hypothetical protein